MTTKRILLVFAHPDDESFTSGATIAKYHREEQAEISLLCATRGQAGKPGEPPICTREELPQVREQELRNAAAILGIRQVILLDYQDKHLQDVPQDELADQVRQAILTIRPQVVITFASHGISGHPDHLAISVATDTAVLSLPPDQNPVKKLYHSTMSSDAAHSSGKTIHTDSPETITTEIAAPQYASIVAEALRAHRTQHQSVERVFPGVTRGETSGVRTVNHFILRWTSLPNMPSTGTAKETDLFAGL